MIIVAPLLSDLLGFYDVDSIAVTLRLTRLDMFLHELFVQGRIPADD